MGGVEKRKIAFFKKTAIILGLLFLAVFLISPVLAQTPPLDLGLDYAKATGLANTDIRIIVAKIIRAALGLVGIIMIGFIIYAGWMYMTAGGNEEKIDTAKRILKNLVIGLAIILSALGIVQFVIQMILGEYLEQVGTGEEAGGFSNEFIIGGFLGPVIESHYPKRNAPWPGESPIPRNTKIIVTFRETVDSTTLFEDTNGDKIFGNTAKGVSDQINSQNIKIYPSSDGETKALGIDSKSVEDDVYAGLSSDKKTIVMKPKNYLGSPTQDVVYTVKLSGVKWSNGDNIFTGTASYYDWQFTVSSEVDLKPPQVDSVIPVPSNEKYPRNIIVQINFNEAVDPIAASGIYKKAGDFDNISVNDGAKNLTGEFKITNQYKTVEFVSDTQCGVNPCGAPIFCLTASATLKVTALAATVDPNNNPQALFLFDPDGVVDMANNSLDGGGELALTPSGQTILPPPKKDGQADGPPVDNFYWSFKTSDAIKAIAPKISAITPSVKEQNVAKNAPIEIIFNELMSLGSFNNLVLKTNKQYNVWYTAAGQNLNAKGEPVQFLAYGAGDAVKTKAQILHGDFWQKPPELNATDAFYYPFVSSKVTDIYQNCFYPASTDGNIVGAPDSKCQDLKSSAPSCFDNASSAVTTPCETKENCPFSDIQP
ncbi:MAG: pilin [Patescibacteria group bacterium]